MDILTTVMREYYFLRIVVENECNCLILFGNLDNIYLKIISLEREIFLVLLNLRLRIVLLWQGINMNI